MPPSGKRKIDQVVADPMPSRKRNSGPKGPKPKANPPRKKKKTPEEKWADEHDKYIAKEYDGLPDERKKVVDQLKNVKFQANGDLVKESHQNPYVNLKRHLDLKKPLQSCMAEAVRVMSPNQKFPTQILTKMMCEQWNPEKVHLPLTEEERKITDKKTFDDIKARLGVNVDISDDVMNKMFGVDADEGNDEANDEANDEGNDEANDEGNDEGNDEANDESSDESNDEGNDDPVTSAQILQLVQFMDKKINVVGGNVVKLFDAMNQAINVVNGMQTKVDQLYTAGGLSESLGLVVAAPAAPADNNGRLFAPAAPAGAVGLPGQQGPQFHAIQQPMVDPATGANVHTVLDTNKLALTLARGEGTKTQEKLDNLANTMNGVGEKLSNLTTQIDSLHISGEHDRIDQLLKKADNIEDSLVDFRKTQATRVATPQSTVDGLNPNARHPAANNQPQPAAAEAVSGGQQPVPTLAHPQPLPTAHNTNHFLSGQNGQVDTTGAVTGGVYSAQPALNQPAAYSSPVPRQQSAPVHAVASHTPTPGQQSAQVHAVGNYPPVSGQQSAQVHAVGSYPPASGQQSAQVHAVGNYPPVSGQQSAQVHAVGSYPPVSGVPQWQQQHSVFLPPGYPHQNTHQHTAYQVDPQASHANPQSHQPNVVYPYTQQPGQMPHYPPQGGGHPPNA